MKLDLTEAFGAAHAEQNQVLRSVVFAFLGRSIPLCNLKREQTLNHSGSFGFRLVRTVSQRRYF
jgi:hypothetical protein